MVTNEQLVQEFPEWTVDKIVKKIGINERHIAADNETAGDMAFKATEKLIAENKVDKGTIVLFYFARRVLTILCPAPPV